MTTTNYYCTFNITHLSNLKSIQNRIERNEKNGFCYFYPNKNEAPKLVMCLQFKFVVTIYNII